MKNFTPTHTEKGPSVRVLPESKGSTLCLELSGAITKDDYERNFRNKIIEITKKEPTVNLLMHYTTSYKGWEPEAADLSLKSIMELGRKVRRQAYINAPEKVLLRNQLSKSLFSGDIRYFEEGKMKEAFEWVTGGENGGN